MTEEQTKMYFYFLVDSLNLAIPLEFVLKVVSLPDLLFLPNLPNSVIGLLNYHGNIYPVFDLGIIYSGKSTQLSIENSVIIGQKKEFKFGILTTKIMGNIEGNEEKIASDREKHENPAFDNKYIKHFDNLVYLSDPMQYLLDEEKEKLIDILQKDE